MPLSFQLCICVAQALSLEVFIWKQNSLTRFHALRLQTSIAWIFLRSRFLSRTLWNLYLRIEVSVTLKVSHRFCTNLVWSLIKWNYDLGQLIRHLSTISGSLLSNHLRIIENQYFWHHIQIPLVLQEKFLEANWEFSNFQKPMFRP